MRNFSPQMKIYDPSSVPQANFTAAVTGIITSSAHGLLEGDVVQVSSTVALPSGLSAATNYYVISPTTNTFKLSATRGGTSVTIADTGTGTHTYKLKGKVILVSDWPNLEIAVHTASSANLTVKIYGSNQEEAPNFFASQSSTNQWDYIQLKLLSDNSTVNGTTGIVASGTDIINNYEVNVNAFKWITAEITSWSAGNLGLSIRGFSL